MSERMLRIRTALQAVDWMTGVADDVVDALVTDARWASLRKDEELFGQGQVIRHLAVIASGFIQSHILSRDGQECFTSIMGRGQALGFNGLFLDHPAQGRHVATESTNVVLIRGETLLDQMQRSPALMLGVLREQSRRNEHLSYLLGDRQLQSHRVRIARLLLMLWEYYAPAAARARPEPELHLSQQRLADLTALTRQAVSLCLRRLQAEGLIEARYSSIALRDLPGLRAIVAQES